MNDDHTFLGVATAFIALLGTIFTAYMAWMVARMNKDVGQVKTMVDGQKSAMQQEVDELKKLIMRSIDQKAPVTVTGLAKVAEDKAARVDEAVKKANGC